MPQSHSLEFSCQSCHEPVIFSVFALESARCQFPCPKCGQRYLFDDPELRRQIQKFAALCQQIRDSEEILGNTSIGIDVGEHRVKVPFKLLLTRLNTSLDLQIGDKPLSIRFRIEPIKEMKPTGTAHATTS